MELGLGVTGAGCPDAAGTGRRGGRSTAEKHAARLSAHAPPDDGPKRKLQDTVEPLAPRILSAGAGGAGGGAGGGGGDGGGYLHMGDGGDGGAPAATGPLLHGKGWPTCDGWTRSKGAIVFPDPPSGLSRARRRRRRAGERVFEAGVAVVDRPDSR